MNPCARVVVPEAVKKTRVALLNGLSQSGYERYAKSRIGKPGEILIEKEENGYYMGLTNEYINGKVKSDGTRKIGDLVNNRQINVPFVTSLALRSASPYGDAKVNSYDR